MPPRNGRIRPSTLRVDFCMSQALACPPQSKGDAMVRLGYHSITWGGVVGDPTGVPSIKDLYYLSNGSAADPGKGTSPAGYPGTQAFDGNPAGPAHQPEEPPEALRAPGAGRGGD